MKKIIVKNIREIERLPIRPTEGFWNDLIEAIEKIQYEGDSSSEIIITIETQ